MAIFSSSKRKKESLGSTNAHGTSSTNSNGNGSNSPPGSVSREFPNRPAQAGASNQLARSYGNDALPQSISQPQLSNSANPNSNGPLSASAPPAHTVLYPWAQRKLNLLPSALLSPSEAANSGNPLSNNPIYGPISAPPFPRYGHSVNPVASIPGGDLYVFGGLVQNAVKNDLYVLSCAPNPGSGGAGPPGGTLSVGLVETRGEVPGPRVGHASVGVGNVLIVWGGDTKSRPEDRQDDGLYLLNLTTREWTRVTTSGPTPEGRYGHAAAMVGSKFFVFGGQKDDGGFMNDLAWFDLQKLKAGSPRWSFVDYAPQAIAPPKRTGHTTVTHGDCIYVFGGTDGQYHYNDTWCYDTDTQLWSELSCIGYIPVPREGHAATLVDDVMYVFGGRGVDGKDLEDLAAFKITTQRWFMFQNMGPAPSGRSGHAMATWQNKVFVLGGESYTSQRADDPSFVHVLDTSKIKYPQDSNRPPQAIARKTSIPAMNNATLPSPPNSSYLPPLVQVHPPATSPPTATTLLPALVEDEPTRRTASPTGRNNGIAPAGQSFGQVFDSPNSSPNSRNVAAGQRGASGATSPPPMRPARPDEPNTTPPQNFSSQFGGSPRAAGVEPSPPSQRSPEGGMRGQLAGEPSSNGMAQDGFYYGSRSMNLPPNATMNGQASSSDVLREKDEEIDALRKRENWMKASLAMARSKGFVVPVSEGQEDGVKDGVKDGEAEVVAENRQIVEALVSMKQELAKAKTALAERAEEMNESVATATQSRLAALQEAAYYRAKLSALESGSAGDITKLDRERTNELEQKLAASLSAKSALEAEVAQLESEVEHHSTVKLAAEERGSSAISRADAVEASYSRSLADYAELQRQAQSHQSTLSDHLLQVATLTAATQRLGAENTHFKERSETSETSLAQHVTTLEATQLALAAANARNEEIHEIWTKTQAELDESRAKVLELQTELDSHKVTSTTATTRAVDLERVLKATREEHEATKLLATGSLAELVASHREAKTREIGNGLDVSMSKASEMEAESFKRLHSETRSKLDETLTELTESRGREVSMQTQMLALRSEVATLRDNHAAALVDVGRHKTFAVNKDVNLRESTRTREAAEIKSVLLRSLMQEHGLSINEEDLASKAVPLDADASPEQLHRRVLELEGRLEQRMRSYTELETAHEGLRKEISESEQRFSEITRQHQSSNEQVDQLTGELERAHSSFSSRSLVASPELTERADSAERELESLQGRHRHLESTQLKAVQYVKGMEKMLKRMKDELTNYKSRNEELEQEIGESDRVINDLKPQLETLHLQVADLRTSSENSAADNEELQLQIARLHAEYENQFQQRRIESTNQLNALEEEITRLDSELLRANHEIDETLAVNNSLNQELKSAMKNSGSTGTKGLGVGGGGLEIELAAANSKADWLKRENQKLEARCREAEEKILTLLDAFEPMNDSRNSEQHSDESIHGPASTHQWARQGDRLRASLSDNDEESTYSGDRSRVSSMVPSVGPLASHR